MLRLFSTFQSVSYSLSSALRLFCSCGVLNTDPLGFCVRESELLSALNIKHYSRSHWLYRRLLPGLWSSSSLPLQLGDWRFCSLHISQIFFVFVPQPDYTSPTDKTPDDVMIRRHPDSRDGSSQTAYKTEPGIETCFPTIHVIDILDLIVVQHWSTILFSDNVYTSYSYENISCISPAKYSTSRKVQDTR